MTVNINPATGIAYGYIAADALDPEVVNDLQSGVDEGYADALIEAQAEVSETSEVILATPQWLVETYGTSFVNTETDYLRYVKENWDGSKWEQEFNDSYKPDEPIHEGSVDLPHGAGTVKYRTSWLGGALHVWIFESPFVTHSAGYASPCVPNAGILDKLNGGVTAYNVPDGWRQEPTEDEVGEWVGQHYTKHYPSLSAQSREEYRHRYMVAMCMIDGTQGTPYESGMQTVNFSAPQARWAVCDATGNVVSALHHETRASAERELHSMWSKSSKADLRFVRESSFGVTPGEGVELRSGRPLYQLRTGTMEHVVTGSFEIRFESPEVLEVFKARQAEFEAELMALLGKYVES